MQRVAQIAFIVLFWTSLSAGNTVVWAQLSPQNQDPSIAPAPIEIWKNGDVIARPEPDTDAPARIIVEFSQPAIASQQYVGAVSKNAQIQSIQAEHQQFEEDLNRIWMAAGSAGKRSLSQAGLLDAPLHFTRAYNGAALTVPQWMVSQIRALEYVQAVHPEGRLFASATVVSDALSKVNAASLNQSIIDPFGKTGQGIRVAIIDTGVDYMHPALGSGYGSLFKVKDGYDFVNEDGDPMDDNGHGTHVAGIVAGKNETWEGVAPEVEIYAYKVLDQDGAGWDSWVLMAIERALDPDNNPLTDDAVDIINLSLGTGAGTDSNHPVTIAVEHAVAAGVVCIVAAGNAGHLGKASIAAPGNALSAVTVGAITDEGNVASFSSQGPTGSIKSSSLPRFGIKPDVFAPGVEVYSTWLDGGFKEMDGTSMATPHITGMAARILEQNRDWSPAQVKAALVQVTDNSGSMPWLLDDNHVGTLPGRELATLATPSRFDFGMVDVSAERWVHADTLTLYNFDDAEKTFDLSVEGGYPAAVQFSFASNAITLAAGERMAVPFTISGLCASIPERSFPDAYTGAIKVVSEGTELSVPFSFFNPGQARLQLDEAADVLFLFGEQGHEYSFFNATGDLYLFLPADRYDAIAEFNGGSHIVIAEDIFQGGNIQTSLSKDNAIHAVQLDLKDIAGQSLNNVSGMHAITHKSSGYSIVRQGGFLSMASNLPQRQYFSEFSDAYKVEIKASGFSNDGDYYEVPVSMYAGIGNDIILTNEPDSLVRINYHYNVAGDHNKLFFVPWTYSSTGDDRRSTIGATLDVEEASPFVMYPPFEKSIYLSPAPAADFPWQGHFHTLHSADFSLFKLATNVRDITLLETDEIRVVSKNVVQVGSDQGVRYEIDQSLDLYPGTGIMHWAGYLDNASSKVRIHEAPVGGFFINEWGDLENRSFSTKLYDEAGQIFADSLFNVPNLPVARWLGESQIAVTPGPYRLVIEDMVQRENGWHARGEAVLEFRTDLADSNPPRISQLFVESDGTPARILHPERQHDIVVGVSEMCSWCDDDADPAFLSVEIRSMQDSTWRFLEIEDSEAGSRLHHAAIPTNLEPAYYALRIVAEDESANRLTYTLEPAFELGISRVPLLHGPQAGQGAASLTPEMSWQGIQGALSYHVQIAEDQAFEYLVSEEKNVASSAWAPGTLEAGHRYYWRVRAKTAEGYMPWAQPVWFETLTNVSAAGNAPIPVRFEMEEIYPNPVLNQASVKYNLPEPAQVKIEIFDLLGRRIKMQEEVMRPAGTYVHTFDASSIASGAYVVRLQAGAYVATQKFVRR